jgi:Na+/proline symporter
MIDNSLNWGKDSTSFWVILFANIFVVLVPYTSDQSVVQRYMTTQDEQKAARAIWINALLCIPSTLIFLAIGTCLWFYFRLHPEQLDPSLPLDSVFPQFIVKVMPAGLAGLVIAGLFAAAQSTVSGSINSMATAFVTDFVKYRRPVITDRGALGLSRWLTGVFGAVATLGAIYIAYFNDQSIWDKYIALIGLGSSGLAGLFILGMTTRRAHAVGALVGAVASAVALAAVWWKCTDLQPHLYAAIGLVTCVAVGYTASLLIPFPIKDLAGLTIHTRIKKSEK